MSKDSTAVGSALGLGDWIDPLEQALRDGVNSYLRELLELEVTAALGRLRYGRQGAARGYRNGHRERELVGTMGRLKVAVPRAQLVAQDGTRREFKSALLPRYRKLTTGALALIAGAYLAGVNTRRVRRALGTLFGAAVSKDTVSRAWRKVQTDFEAWGQRDLSAEPIVRLILDGTVVKVRLDRKASALSVLVVMGVREDGQKVVLAIKAMGGESQAAWRELLDDLLARRMPVPSLIIMDGGKGLEAALAALWPAIPVQRCTVHKHRNLLAHAPKKMHEEIGADYTDMIYAKTAAEVRDKRKAFLRKWKLKCRAVADSLEEAGDRLFTFLRYPEAQWRSIRTSNAIERLNEEFRRRIKTQCVMPSGQTVCMLFWALLASGQITLRKVDGWQTLREPPCELELDRAA
ncbi:MAG: IS256 family transposase [Proteobacteria bacterium]|nr:IS256 family transposase [Pseudomonadota bacterium]